MLSAACVPADFVGLNLEVVAEGGMHDVCPNAALVFSGRRLDSQGRPSNQSEVLHRRHAVKGDDDGPIADSVQRGDARRGARADNLQRHPVRPSQEDHAETEGTIEARKAISWRTTDSPLGDFRWAGRQRQRSEAFCF